jgi:glycosyltransferase involved in cell wall biosynthesis
VPYDGSTPDEQGIGGGITARIRLAAGLARRGHEVSVTCNTPRASVVDGVRYIPLAERRSIDSDILILHTTGDKLDLRPVRDLSVTTRLRIVLVDGTRAPRGLRDVGMDCLCACSNFIRHVASREWRVPASRIFVSHHGVERRLFAADERAPGRRDPFRIGYATHPSKGLDAAVAVWRILRRQDPRFELHVFGGHRLWGGSDRQGLGVGEPGVVFHGLLGQGLLATQLMTCGCVLYLQSRPEPFGIAVAEALAAGAIPVISPVGAHPEIIESGRTGFLVEGDPRDARIHRRAAEIVRMLALSPDVSAAMRRAARSAPLDWNQVASAWEHYWAWLLGERVGRDDLTTPEGCAECGGRCLLLADGCHCQTCGAYRRVNEDTPIGSAAVP